MGGGYSGSRQSSYLGEELNLKKLIEPVCVRNIILHHCETQYPPFITMFLLGNTFPFGMQGRHLPTIALVVCVIDSTFGG